MGGASLKFVVLGLLRCVVVKVKVRLGEVSGLAFHHSPVVFRVGDWDLRN